MQQEKKFRELLKKYRSNRLSEAEFHEFIDLLRMEEEGNFRILDDQIQSDWGLSKRLLKQYDLEKQQKRHFRRRILTVGWSSAAGITLIIMAYFFLGSQQAVEDIIYHTTFGETKKIRLPDESEVLLNANSTLIWQGDWEQRKRRAVVLKGEAYFDVIKVKNISFEVTASDVKVNVLGTAFNVRNREVDAEVFLHKGKVDLSINADGGRNISMEPGDFVRYDKADHAVTIENDNHIGKKAAWVDGMLEFENRKVRLILQEFEDLYGEKFVIENQALADKRMDFSLPYADWDLVRKALEIAIGAEFTEAGDTIFVK